RRAQRLENKPATPSYRLVMPPPHRDPATPAEILKIMPTDAQLEEYYLNQENLHITQRNLPGWGDAITWNELHHTTPYNNTWD
ncbi:hypothetical protein, partial [uncultured Mobiluncus sp.]|uniref:hypothetical protein n=1 Tax=uncultured Mobiluncus sp. TaxID=293425 RepID=UPI0026335378